MAERDRLDQVLVQTQCFSDRPRILGYFKRMCKTRSVMIPDRIQEYLCLVLETAECFGVKDPVAVPLIARPYVACN